MDRIDATGAPRGQRRRGGGNNPERHRRGGKDGDRTTRRRQRQRRIAGGPDQEVIRESRKEVAFLPRVRVERGSIVVSRILPLHVRCDPDDAIHHRIGAGIFREVPESTADRAIREEAPFELHGDYCDALA